jgi:hypothetical protein
MSFIPSTSIVLIAGKHETFDRLASDESVDNLRDVRSRNAPVKKVIGFDQNRHAGGALIETARYAHTRLELGESTRGNLLFQRAIHFFRVLSRAASFRVVVGPTIDADKEIALALQSGESRIRRAAGQRPKIRKRPVGSAVPSGVNPKFISFCAETAHATAHRDFKTIRGQAIRRSLSGFRVLVLGGLILDCISLAPARSTVTSRLYRPCRSPQSLHSTFDL